MNWVLIRKQPKVITNYTHISVIEALRKEGSYQCVYCTLHENLLGGVRNYGVEHHRPKKIFPALEHDYKNLFYCCPVCNSFKGPDWPNDPVRDNSVSSYPNPSKVDYNTIFEIDAVTNEINGTCKASKYMIERLFLNRPHLIMERKRYALDSVCDVLMERADGYFKKLKTMNSEENTKLLCDLGECMKEITQTLRKIDESPAYESKDIKRK